MSSRISLNVIDVKSPCHADWDAMTGGEQARHCAACNKHVYNLSAMTLSDAERLVCESAGSMCVRFERLEDGRVRTLDYQPTTRLRRVGWKGWVGISLVLSTFAAMGQWWWWSRTPSTAGVLMGDIAPPTLVTEQSVLMGRMLIPTAPGQSSDPDTTQGKIPPDAGGI